MIKNYEFKATASEIALFSTPSGGGAQLSVTIVNIVASFPCFCYKISNVQTNGEQSKSFRNAASYPPNSGTRDLERRKKKTYQIQLQQV